MRTRTTLLVLLLGVLDPLNAVAQTVEKKQQPGAASATANKAADTKSTKPALNIAPDALREQAIADVLTARYHAEEVVWLDVEKAKVLAIFIEQTTKTPRGAALVLHGMSGNPDDPELIHALRTTLPKSGWSTFALQLPVLPSGSPREAYGGTVEAAGKRIQAALTHLKEKKLSNVVIIGHELGAALALNAAAGSKEVRAVVAMSVSSADGLNPPVDVAAAIEKLKVPVLDLYGGWDTPAQLKLAEKRVAIARTAKHPSYTQVTLAGTDDMLTNITDSVVIRVRSWINKKATGAGIQAGAQQ